MTEINVEHHPQDSRFIINLAEGQQALLRYRLDSAEPASKQVDFYSTYVPDDYRGHGLAGRLVDAGFAWAEQNDLTIKTSCWYAELKLKRRAKAKG